MVGTRETDLGDMYRESMAIIEEKGRSRNDYLNGDVNSEIKTLWQGRFIWGDGA